MRLKILAAATAVLLGLLAYNHTHTAEYVAAAYEHTMARECESNLTCMLGAAILEPQTVACIQDKLFSTSVKTTEECLKKSIDNFNKKNKE